MTDDNVIALMSSGNRMDEIEQAWIQLKSNPNANIADITEDHEQFVKRMTYIINKARIANENRAMNAIEEVQPDGVELVLQTAEEEEPVPLPRQPTYVAVPELSPQDPDVAAADAAGAGGGNAGIAGTAALLNRPAPAGPAPAGSDPPVEVSIEFTSEDLAKMVNNTNTNGEGVGGADADQQQQPPTQPSANAPRPLPLPLPTPQPNPMYIMTPEQYQQYQVEEQQRMVRERQTRARAVSGASTASGATAPYSPQLSQPMYLRPVNSTSQHSQQQQQQPPPPDSPPPGQERRKRGYYDIEYLNSISTDLIHLDFSHPNVSRLYYLGFSEDQIKRVYVVLRYRNEKRKKKKKNQKKKNKADGGSTKSTKFNVDSDNFVDDMCFTVCLSVCMCVCVCMMCMANKKWFTTSFACVVQCSVHQNKTELSYVGFYD